MTDLKTTILKILDKWANTQEVRLRAGEMTAQELRTAKVVLTGISNEIKDAIEKHENSDEELVKKDET